MSPYLRRLPISLPAIHNELIGSYLGRLADANRIEMATLSHLVIERNWAWRRDDSHCPYWTREATVRLSALTGFKATALARALHITSAAPQQKEPATAARPSSLCRLCAARRGIAGMVLLHPYSHQHVCRHHSRWVHDLTQHDLSRLPDVVQANVLHRKLMRRHGTGMIERSYLRAQKQTLQLFHEPDAPDGLWNQWDQRHQQLPVDQFGDPNRPDENRIELITYPETVTITSVLSSPFWRHHPRLTIEINRRIGYPELGERRRALPKNPQIH